MFCKMGVMVAGGNLTYSLDSVRGNLTYSVDSAGPSPSLIHCGHQCVKEAQCVAVSYTTNKTCFLRMLNNQQILAPISVEFEACPTGFE